jgi:hypothetical protein
MNREWTTEDELRHENRRLAAEVAELRVRAEAAEAWCASWKRGAGINAREIERLRPFEGALREAVREGVLFCSSFNHHRPGCVDCALVDRLSAMVGMRPNPPMNPR